MTNLYYIITETGARVDIDDNKFDMPYYDIVVYAVFEMLEYNITIDDSLMQGLLDVSQLSAYMGDTITIVSYPEIGYEAKEYQYSLDGGTSWISLDTNTFIMPASDVVVSAYFDVIEYQISYVADGATLPAGAIFTYNISNGTIALPSPTKDGYNFIGWYDNAEYTGESISSFSATDLCNKTFYAKFEILSYRVTFKNYDGTTLSSALFEYGKMPTYSGKTPTKPSTMEYDFVFVGWTPELTAVTINAEYTAVFNAVAKKYTITFDTNSGSPVDSREYTYNQELGTLPTSEKIGYTFVGWFTEYVGGTQATASTKVTQSVIYIARWNAINYTITYNLDGGSLSAGAINTYTIDTSVTLPTPTKTGYDFLGWVENEGDTPNASMKINYGCTGEKTFTAKWQIKTFTITWQNDNGDVLETDTNVEYNTIPTYDGATPTKSSTAELEYTFAGWNTTIVAATSNQTYTATYTSQPRTYTITKAIIANGTIICQESAKVGETVDIFIQADDGNCYEVTDIYYIKEGSTEHVAISITSFSMPASNITVYCRIERY